MGEGDELRLWKAVMKDWVSYEGPRGGHGWKNAETGEIRYQEAKPDDDVRGDEVPQQVLDHHNTTEEEFLRHASTAGVGTITSWLEQGGMDHDDANALARALKGEGGDEPSLPGEEETRVPSDVPIFNEYLIPELPKETLERIHDYYILAYKYVNPKLRRGEKLNDYEQGVADALNEGIEEAGEFDEPVVVYRGIRVDDAVVDDLIDSVGSEVTLDGFQSTSLDPMTAQRFAESGNAEKEGIVLEILTDHGLPMYAVPGVTEYGGIQEEDEVLLGHGWTYEVVDYVEPKYEDGIPYPTLQLRVVRTEPTSKAKSLFKDWVPYQGERGGRGWQDTGTGEVRYQEEKPEADGGGQEPPEGEGFLYHDVYDWEQFSSQVEGADALKHRLKNLGDEWYDLTGGWSEKGDLSDALRDEDIGKRWMSAIVTMNDDEKVTTLLALWNNKTRIMAPSEVARSDVALGMKGIVVGALVSRMNPEDLEEFLSAVDVNNPSQNQDTILRAIRTYAPTYELRMKAGNDSSNLPNIPSSDPTASSEEVYAKELPWFDYKTNVMDIGLDQRSWTVRAINGWISDPYGPTGNMMREAAYLFGQNPIHNYPMSGVSVNGVSVQMHPDAVPLHIRDRFMGLQWETERYYRRKHGRTIKLYRGVNQDVTTPNILESWTETKEFASQYGDIVLEAEISPSTILWSTEALLAIDEEAGNAAFGWGEGTPESVKGSEVAVMAGSYNL